MLILATRMIFFIAYAFGFPIAAFFLVWVGYETLIKNRQRRGNKTPPDNETSVQSQS